MINDLQSIVNLVTGSLVLFSSIGIFVLTLNARYTHAIGRVRDIYEDLTVDRDCKKLERELNMMVFRCQLLKWSFGLLLASALSSGIFLLGSIFTEVTHENHTEILIALIVGSVLFIFSSMLFLFFDVLVSLKATMIHIERWK